MQRYYTVNPGCKLEKQYFEWKEKRKEFGKTVANFLENHGIETREYYPTKTWLAVVPSPKDKDEFRNDFTQTYLDNGLRQFKVRSEIGKDWARTVSDMPIVSGRFHIDHLFRIDCGRFSQQVFEVDGLIYCTFYAEWTFSNPDCLTEILASQYYKVIEDYNASIKTEEAEQ